MPAGESTGAVRGPTQSIPVTAPTTNSRRPSAAGGGGVESVLRAAIEAQQAWRRVSSSQTAQVSSEASYDNGALQRRPSVGVVIPNAAMPADDVKHPSPEGARAATVAPAFPPDSRVARGPLADENRLFRQDSREQPSSRLTSSDEVTVGHTDGVRISGLYDGDRSAKPQPRRSTHILQVASLAPPASTLPPAHSSSSSNSDLRRTTDATGTSLPASLHVATVVSRPSVPLKALAPPLSSQLGSSRVEPSAEKAHGVEPQPGVSSGNTVTLSPTRPEDAACRWLADASPPAPSNVRSVSSTEAEGESPKSGHVSAPSSTAAAVNTSSVGLPCDVPVPGAVSGNAAAAVRVDAFLPPMPSVAPESAPRGAVAGRLDDKAVGPPIPASAASDNAAASIHVNAVPMQSEAASQPAPRGAEAGRFPDKAMASVTPERPVAAPAPVPPSSKKGTRRAGVAQLLQQHQMQEQAVEAALAALAARRTGAQASPTASPVPCPTPAVPASADLSATTVASSSASVPAALRNPLQPQNSGSFAPPVSTRLGPPTPPSSGTPIRHRYAAPVASQGSPPGSSEPRVPEPTQADGDDDDSADSASSWRQPVSRAGLSYPSRVASHAAGGVAAASSSRQQQSLVSGGGGVSKSQAGGPVPRNESVPVATRRDASTWDAATSLAAVTQFSTAQPVSRRRGP